MLAIQFMKYLSLRIISIILILCVLNSYAANPHPEWTNSLKPVGISGNEITLSYEGKTEYRIVIPAFPTTMEEKASNDLKMCLNQMTGATFEIVREGTGFTSNGKEISIGNTNLYKSSGITLSHSNLSRCGYGIAQKGNILFIVGGSHRGIINGVYCFLEEDLGCRWYAPGDSVIPNEPTLKFKPVIRSYVPALEDRRDPYNADTMFDVDWSLRNKTLGSYAKVPAEWGDIKGWPVGAHTLQRFLPSSLFGEHPEYFAEINGERTPVTHCLSSQGGLDLVIKQVKNMLRDWPETRFMDISLNDTTTYCQCSECKKLAEFEGSQMGPLLKFVNSVADAIKDEHPNTLINTLAYQGTLTPPKTIKPRPNVSFWLCTDPRWGVPNEYVYNIPILANAFKEWHKTGARLVVWDYPTSFNYLTINLSTPTLQQNLKYFVENGATGVRFQHDHNVCNYGADHSFMFSWIEAKLLWDHRLDLRKLIRDFNYGYYGQAAPLMQKYDEMIWSAFQRYHQQLNLSPEQRKNQIDEIFLKKAWELLSEAESIVVNDPNLLSRVQIAQMPLMWNMAQNGPGLDPIGYGKMLDKFEKIIKISGMKEFAPDFSGKGTAVDKYFEIWRKLIDVGFDQ